MRDHAPLGVHALLRKLFNFNCESLVMCFCRWDFTSSELRGEGNGDKNGHGTHVAGCAGASTYGMAKRSTLRDVKVKKKISELY